MILDFNRFKSYRILAPFVVSLVFVSLMFALHMSRSADSMLNEKNHVISNGFLTSQINYHKELPPFARRPLTTFLIESVADWFQIRPGVAFIWVNFGLLFLSGILLFRLSITLHDDVKMAIINMILYFLTFPVFFAFFPPIFSYDEPLQYCLLFAMLSAFLKKRWFYFVIWGSLAVIARENSVFVLLSLLICFPPLKYTLPLRISAGHIRHLALVSLPLCIYGLYLLCFVWLNDMWNPTKDEFSSRLSCFFANFEDVHASLETFFSLFLTLGPFGYFLWSYLRKKRIPSIQSNFVNGFLMALAFNTVVVVIATFAREARLFAIPLFFLWPWAATFIGDGIRKMMTSETISGFFTNWQYSLAFVIWGVVNYMIAFKVYIPSFPPSDNFFNEYLFILLELMSFHFLLNRYASLRLSP